MEAAAEGVGEEAVVKWAGLLYQGHIGFVCFLY